MSSRRARWLHRLLLALALFALATIPTWMVLLPPAPSSTADPPELPQAAAGEYAPVPWELLSGFVYDLPLGRELAGRTADQLRERTERIFPEAVRALDGRHVAVRGFLIPAQIRQGKVTQFILAAKNEVGCCFGDGLGISEWIVVDAEQAEDVSRDFLGQVTTLGTLEVGEDVTEGGYVMSLYRMKAHRVVPASS